MNFVKKTSKQKANFLIDRRRISLIFSIAHGNISLFLSINREGISQILTLGHAKYHRIRQMVTEKKSISSVDLEKKSQQLMAEKITNFIKGLREKKRVTEKET